MPTSAFIFNIPLYCCFVCLCVCAGFRLSLLLRPASVLGPCLMCALGTLNKFTIKRIWSRVNQPQPTVACSTTTSKMPPLSFSLTLCSYLALSLFRLLVNFTQIAALPSLSVWVFVLCPVHWLNYKICSRTNVTSHIKCLYTHTHTQQPLSHTPCPAEPSTHYKQTGSLAATLN